MLSRSLITAYLFLIVSFWPCTEYFKEANFRHFVVDATFPLSDPLYASSPSSSSSSSSIYRRLDCKICGYEYDEAVVGTRWDDLAPDKFECPVCRAPKSMFNDVPIDVTPLSQQSIDMFYMKRALNLASLARGRTRPNPAVGCVIVDPTSGAVVGEGYHVKAGMDHAEVMVDRHFITAHLCPCINNFLSMKYFRYYYAVGA